MSLYQKRGVSAQKEEVHAATKNLDKGLFPNAFCKIFPDILGGDKDWVNVMHADGAGTKSILAYLYWKETGDITVWKKIAQDAIVMNLDDLLCVGIYDNLAFSSTIDRNKQLIPGEVLEAIIGGTQEFFDKLAEFNIHVSYMGGETADVGDVVRNIAVNGTIGARWPAKKLVTNENIQPGDLIIGLAGFGYCNYEAGYNSGIGSNGLTSARHDMLNSFYAENYPETFDNSLDEEVIYSGKYRLTDQVDVDGIRSEVGELLLSPTRTFAPVIREILEDHFVSTHGLVHCSGGGQTKCLKYLPSNVRVIKDNLFDPPGIFKLIQEGSRADDREMYQVFNMGPRMEIYTPGSAVQDCIRIAEKYGVEAQVIGRVEKADKKELILVVKENKLLFN